MHGETIKVKKKSVPLVKVYVSNVHNTDERELLYIREVKISNCNQG